MRTTSASRAPSAANRRSRPSGWSIARAGTGATSTIAMLHPGRSSADAAAGSSPATASNWACSHPRRASQAAGPTAIAARGRGSAGDISGRRRTTARRLAGRLVACAVSPSVRPGAGAICRNRASRLVVTRLWSAGFSPTRILRSGYLPEGAAAGDADAEAEAEAETEAEAEADGDAVAARDEQLTVTVRSFETKSMSWLAGW